MTATLDDEVADLRRANAELQQRLDERTSERDEAEAQKAAMAEVLEVINSSAGNLAPVFDAMLEKAMLLCGAAFGELRTYDGERFRLAATRGVPSSYVEYYSRHVSGVYGPGTAPARILAGERIVHVPDLTATEPYQRGDPDRRALVDLGGARAIVLVPLLKDDAVSGYIMIFRQEPGPFSDKQIALLQNFAAQAVIAMENARLITETREALEQQTATAEVLGVINSSPGDLTPVFDAILEKAHALCGATFGSLQTYDGEFFHMVASRGLPDTFLKLLREPFRPDPNSFEERLVRGDDLVHIPDVTRLGPLPDDPLSHTAVETAGLRTLLLLPLRKEAALVGYVASARSEVRPFSDKQIALLQNFAAQAVIAIENARLITETRDALEQQTATAEVLRVINSSPGHLAPVFDAMLDKATRLSAAAFGILWTYDGERFQAVAFHDVPPAYMEFLREPQVASPVAPLGRVARGEAFALVPDLAAEEYHERAGFLVRQGLSLGGFRTVLAVPMRKDGSLLGAITIYRREVQPFSEKQIALLLSFAAQAVIAMENARLITETREALEQQTATAEVLQVINSSPGDLAPVFDAILEKAMRLCRADQGDVFYRFDDGAYRMGGASGVPDAYREIEANVVIIPGRDTLVGRVAMQAAPVQIVDVQADPEYLPKEDARIGNVQTMLGVPLLRDGVPVGVFGLGRRRVEAFSDREIALVTGFAAQAVIAMENARLITETREALDQQTATAEVLQVINASPGHLTPVFDAMLDKAMRLCNAAFGYMMTYDGEQFTEVAHRGLPSRFADYLPRMHQPGPHGMYARIRAGAPFVQVSDLSEGEVYRTSPLRKALVDLGGARTGIVVALRKDETLLGVITVYRQEVRPFSNEQIALLQNFAAQAVIAIENARLLDEIRQRQAELRVTFDNMADGVAMFDEHLRLAAWNRNFQQIVDLPEALLADRPTYAEYLRILTERGELDALANDAELSRLVEHTDQELRLERTRPGGCVIEVRRNAVPDGGFVLIYSDITERKRSEAEIREARDAAEATLRDLKAAQANLIQAEKMASLGQLTAGIAHEIKNPLNFVNNFAGLSVELLDELKETAAPALAKLAKQDRADVDETIELLTSNLEKIAEHGRRADGIVKSMLEHSRGVTSERRAVDLNNLVEEALNLAYHGARAQDQNFNITLDRDYERNLAKIELVPQEMSRVFINLISNGFYAATKRRRENGEADFHPILKVSTHDCGDAVEIRIRDNGTGIPAEIKDKLFQPFFTTKPTGEGTGLGLSISYDIVTQQHGGTITVDSRVGEFTEFTVRLPGSYRAASTGAAA